MALLKYILGFRDFAKLDDIKKFINLNLFYTKEEDVLNSEYLVLFDTSKQKTWIIVSNYRLFCVLDDISKDTFIVRWDLKKNEVLRNGKIILDIEIQDNYSQNSGLIDFGKNHREWLYSKKLFPMPKKLRHAIEETIHKAMD